MELDGFEQYVRDRQRSLLRTAWLLTRDWPRAEDLVQTALVKVWPRWRRVVRGGDPDPYVRQTLIRTYLSWNRRRWHAEQPSELVADIPDDQDTFRAVDLRDVLARVLPTLPARQQAALILRFYEDLSVEQTAEALGCSTGTVKSQTAHALAKLKSMDLKGELR
jgi:RNA polymerase sigma-70 factor (sigma-E family)